MIDESGEDYLYPQHYFSQVEMVRDLEQVDSCRDVLISDK